MPRGSGWRETLFAVARERAASGGGSDEDERSADWIYLLPALSGRTVLLLGPGNGNVMAALDRAGAITLVADPALPTLTAPDGSADVVAATDPSWPGGPDPGLLCREARRVLRPGGWLYLRANVRSAPPSLAAVRRAIGAAGLREIDVRAQLPERGVPLFTVPLDGGAMRHFLGYVLPLVTTASAEMRGRHRSLLWLAGLATRVARWPLADRIARGAVRNVAVIARSPEAPSGAP